MEIKTLLRQKKISVYRLSIDTGIPYTTLNDICSGKSSLAKCSCETVYRISRALNVSMEDILAPLMEKRSSFENFKSAVCHRLKEMGDIDFIVDTLKSREIRTFYVRKWYPECFYLLAMLDYLCRINCVPLCNEYDDLRTMKLKKTVYPAGIKAFAVVSGKKDLLEDAVKKSIPEFIRFNIVENEVRNVA